jgi:hypothetical protein
VRELAARRNSPRVRVAPGDASEGRMGIAPARFLTDPISKSATTGVEIR